MKIHIGKAPNYESLVEKTRLAIGDRDASKFTLRADKDGNFSIVAKENFLQRLFLRSGQTKNAFEAVNRLINAGVRSRHTRVNLGDDTLSAGESALVKAGAGYVDFRGERGYVAVPSNKFRLEVLLGDTLNKEVSDFFRFAENKKKWDGYNGPKTDETSRVNYLKSALVSEQFGSPESAYRQLCCPGHSQDIKASEFHDNALKDRSIEFIPSGSGDAPPWFQLGVAGIRNGPSISYAEPTSRGEPKHMNGPRLHSFDKFRISVHPEDMEKAFAIVWSRIGHDMATSENPSVFAFKVHDVEKHATHGKTNKNHQFTLYLPLPDGIVNIYDQNSGGHENLAVRGGAVNNALCSDRQAHDFCQLMMNIEHDFQEAGIRPSNERNADFNTDYNIQGSNYFSMRNELLNDRDKSRTPEENVVLSQRQLPKLMEEMLIG